jgi:hypothetical protein
MQSLPFLSSNHTLKRDGSFSGGDSSHPSKKTATSSYSPPQATAGTGDFHKVESSMIVLNLVFPLFPLVFIGFFFLYVQTVTLMCHSFFFPFFLSLSYAIVSLNK